MADEELNIPALLDAQDMVDLIIPDKLSVATYLVQYYNYFKDKTPAPKKGGVPQQQSRVPAATPTAMPTAPPSATSSPAAGVVAAEKKANNHKGSNQNQNSGSRAPYTPSSQTPAGSRAAFTQGSQAVHHHSPAALSNGMPSSITTKSQQQKKTANTNTELPKNYVLSKQASNESPSGSSKPVLKQLGSSSNKLTSQQFDDASPYLTPSPKGTKGVPGHVTGAPRRSTESSVLSAHHPSRQPQGNLSQLISAMQGRTSPFGVTATEKVSPATTSSSIPSKPLPPSLSSNRKDPSKSEAVMKSGGDSVKAAAAAVPAPSRSAGAKQQQDKGKEAETNKKEVSVRKPEDSNVGEGASSYLRQPKENGGKKEISKEKKASKWSQVPPTEKETRIPQTPQPWEAKNKGTSKEVEKKTSREGEKSINKQPTSRVIGGNGGGGVGKGQEKGGGGKRGMMGMEQCADCGQRVFLMERLGVENRVFHRNCFNCSKCRIRLKAGSYEYDAATDKFYCRQHYREALRTQTIRRSMIARGMNIVQLPDSESQGEATVESATKVTSKNQEKSGPGKHKQTEKVTNKHTKQTTVSGKVLTEPSKATTAVAQASSTATTNGSAGMGVVGIVYPKGASPKSSPPLPPAPYVSSTTTTTTTTTKAAGLPPSTVKYLGRNKTIMEATPTSTHPPSSSKMSADESKTPSKPARSPKHEGDSEESDDSGKKKALRPCLSSPLSSSSSPPPTSMQKQPPIKESTRPKRTAPPRPNYAPTSVHNSERRTKRKMRMRYLRRKLEDLEKEQATMATKGVDVEKNLREEEVKIQNVGGSVAR